MNWFKGFFVFFFGNLIINVSEFTCQDVSQVVPVPFKFGYNSNDELNVIITLKNIPSGIAYVNMRTKMANLQTLSHKTVPADRVLTVTQSLALKRSRVLIQAEIYNAAGLCEKKTIVDAEEVNTTGQTDYTYNNFCLQKQSCLIEVDLSKACSGDLVL